VVEGAVTEGAVGLIEQADELAGGGDCGAAVDLLTRANRAARRTDLERALMRLRREGGAAASVTAAAGAGDVLEIDAAHLFVAASPSCSDDD
jgi:hypothetical protein